MKPTNSPWRAALLAVVLVLLLVATVLVATLPAAAEPLTGIAWYVWSGGGAASSGGTVTLNGSLGQPVSGMSSAGEALSLRSGFWQTRGGAPLNQRRILLPVVFK